MEGEYRAYTNLWRQSIPYGSKSVSAARVMEAAKKIYANSPKLLELAMSAFRR